MVGDPRAPLRDLRALRHDYLSARELAAVVEAISGRPVVAQRVPVAHAFSGAAGERPTEEDDWRRDAMVRLFDHYGRYGITGNPNVLGWLLGRPPTSFEEYARRSLG